jgi:tetratricopeptide (TPR) repeat protein
MASLDALYHEAIEAGRGRDYPHAIELLNEVLAGDEADSYPHALLFLGRSHHALGDFPRAIEALSAFEQQRPESAAAYFFLGRALLAAGMRDAAVGRLERSIELQPELQAAHSLLGVCHLRNRNSDAALLALTRARELNPDHEPTRNAYYNAAVVNAIARFHRGEAEAAADLLEQVLADGHDHVMARIYLSRIYRELGRIGRALVHLDAAGKMAPDDPSLPLQRALLLSLAGDNDGALRELGRMQAIEGRGALPNTTEPLALMRLITSVLFGSGRYRQALYFGRRYLREEFEDVDVHLMVAECHRNLGALQKASNHLERALERDRTRLDVRYAKVLTLWQRGRFAAVLKELGAIQQLVPEDDGTTYYESLCRHELQQEPQTVIPLLQQELRRRGEDLPLMTALAQEYLRIELPELASGWLKRSLVVNPTHVGSLRTLIDAQEQQADLKAVYDAYSRYLQSNTSDRDMRERFVEFLFTNEQWSSAADEIVRVMPHRPEDDQLRRRLAHCYEQTRRYTEAIVLYRELLGRDLDSDPLLSALLRCLEKSRNRRYAISLLQRVLRRTPGRPGFTAALGRLQMREGDLEQATATLRSAVADEPNNWQALHDLALAYKRTGDTEFAEKYRKRASEIRARQQKAKPADALSSP